MSVNIFCTLGQPFGEVLFPDARLVFDEYCSSVCLFDHYLLVGV